MKPSVQYYFFLLVIIFISACKSNDEAPPVSQNNFYDFNLGITMNDTKSEYQVNDIIRFEVIIPNNHLREVQGGELIHISNAVVNLDLAINSFFPFPTSTSVFELILEEGEIVDEDDFSAFGNATLAYGCPAPNYKLKFGIKFKQSGNYLIQLHKGGIAEQIVFLEDGDCSVQVGTPIPPEASIGSLIYFFDISDVNKSVYDTYIDETPEALDEDISPYVTALENSLGYFVKVN